jgi:hypothetical protein
MTTTETPAAQLRAAANGMRQDAAAATPGPWRHMCLGSEGCVVTRTSGPLRERHTRGTVARFGWKEWKADHADAVFVASMHPGVALAVADWLEAEAGRAADLDGYEDSAAYPLMLAGFRHPLAVARAYLGEAERAVRAQLGETDGP